MSATRRYTIRCPGCGHVSPWEPQSVAVVVRCPNREFTAMYPDASGTLRPDYAHQMYATTDRKQCWIEMYLPGPNAPDDNPDRAPRWKCGREFIVPAIARRAAA